MTSAGKSLPPRWMEKGKKAKLGGPSDEVQMNHVNKISSQVSLGLNGLRLHG